MFGSRKLLKKKLFIFSHDRLFHEKYKTIKILIHFKNNLILTKNNVEIRERSSE